MASSGDDKRTRRAREIARAIFVDGKPPSSVVAVGRKRANLWAQEFDSTGIAANNWKAMANHLADRFVPAFRQLAQQRVSQQEALQPVFAEIRRLTAPRRGKGRLKISEAMRLLLGTGVDTSRLRAAYAQDQRHRRFEKWRLERDRIDSE